MLVPLWPVPIVCISKNVLTSKYTLRIKSFPAQIPQMCLVGLFYPTLIQGCCRSLGGIRSCTGINNCIGCSYTCGLYPLFVYLRILTQSKGTQVQMQSYRCNLKPNLVTRLLYTFKCN